MLVTDLDNTVYDWEAFFVPSFLAMLEQVEWISGLDRQALESSFRRVYQSHRTTEYAFALQELDALTTADGDISDAERLHKYDPAIHAFRSNRRRRLQLYPGVRETLQVLRQAGVVIVAHSDSPMGYVSRRLRQLDVDTLFDAICAPSDHGLPEGTRAETVRHVADVDVMARTMHLEFDPSLRKPDPATLAPITSQFRTPVARIGYVGDNLSRDMLLARRAGIAGIWAQYGATHDPILREQLLRITYWTDEDVALEVKLREEAVSIPPPFTIASYPELLGIFGVSDESN